MLRLQFDFFDFVVPKTSKQEVQWVKTYGVVCILLSDWLLSVELVQQGTCVHDLYALKLKQKGVQLLCSHSRKISYPIVYITFVFEKITST